jgi:hypothetical protein
MNNYGILDLTQILISKKFEKEIVFESSFLAWIRIRIEQKCWIRIRIKSFRIHNPALNNTVSFQVSFNAQWINLGKFMLLFSQNDPVC